MRTIRTPVLLTICPNEAIDSCAHFQTVALCAARLRSYYFKCLEDVVQLSKVLVVVCLSVTSLLLAACGGTPTGAQFVEAVKREDVASLCYTYGMSSTPLTAKLAIEAELISRGEKSCYGTNLGRTSVALLGKSYFDRGDGTSKASASGYSAAKVTSGAVDCSDFPSSAAAQKYFLASGGPAQDPHNLDGDGDGLACEWGKAARKAYSYRAPVYRPTSYSSGRTCYTGPRGGTYTITASGNKNYSGC